MGALPNIPRVYTALAEWLACMIFILPAHKRRGWKSIVLFSLIGQIILQEISGMMPLFLWIPGMIFNVIWMYFTIQLTIKSNYRYAIYLCSKAFIFAEFTASFTWQIYAQFLWNPKQQINIISVSFMLLLCALLITGFYYFESKLSSQYMQNNMSNKDIFTVILTAIMIFSMSNVGFVFNTAENNIHISTTIFITRTLVNLSGILIIYLQDKQKHELGLLSELNSINNMFQTQYEQYIAYRESSEQINQKFHDLKYQIDIIRAETELPKREAYLEEMSQVLSNYSVNISTGNGIIDTILTRKNSYCVENDITFTCIVDGKLLNHLDVMDTVSLLGNALDNAVEAVEKNPIKEERLINLRVFRKNNFILIHLENYTKRNIDLSEGLPKTTKSNKDYHGFGIKSIQYITDKYNGNMSIQHKNNWFSLKILLPIERENAHSEE